MNNQNENLTCSVERVTYCSEETGFCVLKVRVKGHRELVTLTAKLPSVSTGESLSCTGNWVYDKNHGKQFKAEKVESSLPTTLSEIEKYLASGTIKGIGVHFAKKLIQKFGEGIFDIIENYPERLLEIGNIGRSRTESICASWKEQKAIREIMIFLQTHGLGLSRAARIYRTYGDQTMKIISSNPYQLAYDIRGIGFTVADKIAHSLGIPKSSTHRIRSGITHVLLEATSDGHCGMPAGELIQKAAKLLGVERELIEEAIELDTGVGVLMQDTLIVNDSSAFLDNHNKAEQSNIVDAVFLASYYIYEKQSARVLLDLSKGHVPWKNIDALQEVASAEKSLNIKLADGQRLAIKNALEQKAMIITGGPGTGKTTIVNFILKILSNKKLKVKLCAPTGRAARRLSESTGLEATTIHRLLEVDFNGNSFKKNKDNRLSADYVIVDEVSMVDIQLFYNLIQAIPEHAALLFVGDVDQLPSVGAGQVLADIIESKAIPTIKLTEIFRQAEKSEIIINAHRINHGLMPFLSGEDNSEAKKSSIKNSAANEKDFYFIPAEPGEDLVQKLLKLVKTRIPTRFGFDPIKDIQILTPMQLGESGVRSLNIELQKSLNPNHESGISKYGQQFAVGDKVMQIENDYDKEVYNGDIGLIQTINSSEQTLVVNFYGKHIQFAFIDLDKLTLAYATTIHKSQGSEYPAIIIPLTMQSYKLLQRNLLYTAITRGKNLVIVIGEKKAIYTAVHNSKSTKRYTKLYEWLKQSSVSE